MVIPENEYSQKINQVAANEMENKYKCWNWRGCKKETKLNGLIKVKNDY